MEKKAAAILVSRCNTKAMNLHLAEISSQVGADTLAVLVRDGAGWHKSKDLVAPENVVLLHLPPYSPELNPMERIWWFLRSHFPSNRLFADGAAVIDACLDARNRFIAVPERTASLCHVAWAIPPENTEIPALES